MSLSNYLHQRPGSPNWHVRLAVPTHLQKTLNRREITRSMRTSDRRQAEQKAMKFISEQRELFDSLTGEDEAVAPADLNERIVGVYYDKFLEELSKRSKEFASQGIDQLENWLGKLRVQQAEWKRRVIAEDYKRVADIAASFIDREHFKIDKKSNDFKGLLPTITTAIIEALDVTIRRLEGEIDAQPKSSYVEGVLVQRSNMARDGERLSDHKVKYLSELVTEQNRKPTNVEPIGVIIDLFIEWCGDGKSVNSLTKKNASAFREVLDGFPVSRMKMKRLASAPISVCIRIAKNEGLGLLSQSTKAKYISQISTFFGWMLKRGICDSNIWDGMTYKANKTANRRPSFNTEQLNQILQSPLYCGFVRDGKEHLPGDHQADDWRYWLPLVCMFTGARITEIAQLHVDDIEERDGYLIGYLQADRSRGQSLKTEKSKRLVVFNSKLVAAGYKDYWQKQLDRSQLDDNTQLFPELKAGKRPDLGAKPSRWWRDYLVKIGVKKKGEADGIGSHSFRHRLADEMRSAGYLDSEFGEIVMGHAQNTMTSRYGDISQGTVERLAEMIENAKFEGVDFRSILRNHKQFS